ncbi:MAG: radical SAM protein [Thermoplasmata archaeon]
MIGKFLEDLIFLKERFEPIYILKHLDVKRLRNLLNSYIARRFGFVFFKPLRPVTVFIEVTRGCNFSCVMCPASEFKISFMSFDTFKRVLDEFQDAVFIYPYGTGEPFLNPSIYQMLEYAVKRNFITTAFTNLSKINPDMLMKTGIRDIFVSIDSVDPDEFSHIRRNGNLSVFIKNLELLLSARKRYGLSIPKIGFSITLLDRNTDSVDKIIDFGLSLGINTFYLQTVFKAGFMNPPVGIPSNSQIEGIRYLKRKYGRRAKILLSSHYQYEKGDFFTGYCLFAYTSIFVDVEGKIFTCTCGASPSKREQNLGYISDTENAIMRRQEFLESFSKRIPEYCFGCPIYFRDF